MCKRLSSEQVNIADALRNKFIDHYSCRFKRNVFIRLIFFKTMDTPEIALLGYFKRSKLNFRCAAGNQRQFFLFGPDQYPLLQQRLKSTRLKQRVRQLAI